MSTRFDDQGLDSLNGRVRWSEVVAVGIRTTDDGPFADDLFWQLLLDDGVCELPGRLVDGEAVGVMQRQLPGLDSSKIIRAMGSTNHRQFRVWHFDESLTPWSDRGGEARFIALVSRLGGNIAGAVECFSRLRAAWSTEGRRYHDLEHLADCLRELDGVSAARSVADVAEWALWFHDAVYEPTARDCEERSALLLEKESVRLRLPPQAIDAAAQCVRATAHLDGPSVTGPLADLVVDIDLSILGRDVFRFLEFDYSIEEEYARVCSTLFQVKRGRFLARLLASPAIFRTAHFRERYEANARTNIAALLRSGRYTAYRWLGWLARAR